jgi:hypothetical protein
MNRIMDEYTQVQLLKKILDKSSISHKDEIIQQKTLKDAHIYCKINELPGQVSGILIENYIKIKYGMIKNDASLCVGDLTPTDVNFEIKISLGGKSSNKFNYVQLRMNHSCEYLLTAYYLDISNVNYRGELFIFRLSKNQIKPLILQFGEYAHGTIHKLGEITQSDLDDTNNNKEYALRPKYGDTCWKSLLHYRISEITI